MVSSNEPSILNGVVGLGSALAYGLMNNCTGVDFTPKRIFVSLSAEGEFSVLNITSRDSDWGWLKKHYDGREIHDVKLLTNGRLILINSPRDIQSGDCLVIGLQ